MFIQEQLAKQINAIVFLLPAAQVNQFLQSGVIMALTLRVTEADEAAIEELKSLTGQVTASGAIMAAVRDYARQLELVQYHLADADSLRRQLSDVRSIVVRYQQAANALMRFE